jgi:hypothetical protein
MARVTMDGTALVSPTVMATYLVNGAPGSPTMTVAYVILWRGEPGWMGNGNSRPVPVAGGTTRRQVGPHVLDVTADAAMTSATVAGTTVDLRKTNAIFVDGADRASAAKVVDTRFIDVQLPKTAQGTELTRRIFDHLTTLAAFADCGSSVAGPPMGGYCMQVNASPR